MHLAATQADAGSIPALFSTPLQDRDSGGTGYHARLAQLVRAPSS